MPTLDLSLQVWIYNCRESGGKNNFWTLSCWQCLLRISPHQSSTCLQLYMPTFLCVLLNYLTFFAASLFLVSQVPSIWIVWYFILPCSSLKLICQNIKNIKVLWWPWIVLKDKNIQYSTMHNRFFLKRENS